MELCNGFSIHHLHLCRAKSIRELNIITMGNLLYTIAIILVVGWAIGFIGFHAGGLIHVLLLIALVAVLLRVISGNKAI